MSRLDVDVLAEDGRNGHSRHPYVTGVRGHPLRAPESSDPGGTAVGGTKPACGMRDSTTAFGR